MTAWVVSLAASTRFGEADRRTPRSGQQPFIPGYVADAY
jgi:hypothetical protein